MALDSLLNASDSVRVAHSLHMLAAHDISDWALTGGIAIELHVLRCGGEPVARPLHDIDFLVSSFESIPETLGRELLLRHVHPDDPPGKNMLQGVDRATEVRIDAFRAYGLEMERTSLVEIAGFAFRMVSLQDLIARHARLNWNLMEGKPVAPKYARDFLRIVNLVPTGEIEGIWQEHRKPECPESFAGAVFQLRRVIASRPELLISPTYSTDVEKVCPRCRDVEAFPLADPRRILAVLGYC